MRLLAAGPQKACQPPSPQMQAMVRGRGRRGSSTARSGHPPTNFEALGRGCRRAKSADPRDRPSRRVDRAERSDDTSALAKSGASIGGLSGPDRRCRAAQGGEPVVGPSEVRRRSSAKGGSVKGVRGKGKKRGPSDPEQCQPIRRPPRTWTDKRAAHGTTRPPQGLPTPLGGTKWRYLRDSVHTRLGPRPGGAAQGEARLER